MHKLWCLLLLLGAACCEAGLLGNVRQALHDGTHKVEQRLSSILGKNPPTRTLQATAPTPYVVEKPISGLVYKSPVTSTKPPELGSYVVTAEDDSEEEPAHKPLRIIGPATEAPKRFTTPRNNLETSTIDERAIIEGAPRCGPDEMFLDGNCRSLE